MKPRVGLITIGQSPRSDITPDLFSIWEDKISVIEKGALDNLTPHEIGMLKPVPGETVLVSRLRDGKSATLAEERLIPLIKQQISFLEDCVDLIFLMCTGKFNGLSSQVPLIQPDGILRNTVKGILEDNQILGVLVPEKEQIAEVENIWKSYFSNKVKIVTAYGSPYKDINLIQKGAESLKKQGADLVVLDCMGYSTFMKKEVKAITDKPVILPRTLIARIIQEIV
ncbi:MAG: AroM family protein [Peptococcales bacterium]|jgi:protein AroM